MIIERDRQYTPDDVLQICAEPPQNFTSSIERKQLYEAEVVAGMLKAMENTPKCLGDHLEIVDSTIEFTPDIRVISLKQNGRYKPSEDVEVVSFTDHSKSEGILAFFLRTKLSPVYAYPKETILLCHIDTPVRNPIDMARRVGGILQNLPQVNHRMYLLFGKPQGPNCTLAQVFPELFYFENRF